MSSYYDDQIIPIINETNEFKPRIQICGEESKSKYLSISRHKLAKILAILNEPDDKVSNEDEVDIRRRIA